MRVKMSAIIVRARAIHRVDRKLHSRLRNQIKIGKALDGLQIRRQEINFLDLRRLRSFRDRLTKISLDLRDNRRLAGAAVPRLVFHAVPLRGIVRRGDHDATRRSALAHTEAQRGSGSDVVGQHDRNACCGDNLGTCARKRFGAEARVVADAKPFGGIFFRVHISGDGFGGGADIGKSKIVGDNGTPAVGAELDLWVGHAFFLSPWPQRN